MNYEIRVTLKGMKKVFNRIIAVNDNISLEDFCEGIVLSMNGELEHAYILNHNHMRYVPKEFELWDESDNYITNKKLRYLDLKVEDKLLLEYDLGDGWEFEITVRSENQGYLDKNFSVISGKGKGIVEDCGGIGGLEEFVNGTVDEEIKEWYLTVWDDNMYDVEDFNLEEINKKIDEWYQA